MGDVYASVICMSVLQLKEIPVRPTEYDGILCLFDVHGGVDEAAICSALAPFGEITGFEASPARTIVRFTTHEAALAVRRAAAAADEQFQGLFGGADTLYNERSYDGRQGEAARDDDDGRGWCCLESAVSVELIARLSAFPRMRASLDLLPPKVFSLSSEYDPSPLPLEHLAGGQHVDEARRSIERATFTGKGDKPRVIQLYNDYVAKVARTLQKTLAFQTDQTSDLVRTQAANLSTPPPQVAAPIAAPLRLAADQLLLLFIKEQTDVQATVRFCKLDRRGQIPTIGGGSSSKGRDPAYDGCSQAVIPWRPVVKGWDKPLLKLHALLAKARRVHGDALALVSDSPGAKQMKTQRKAAARVLALMRKHAVVAAVAQEAEAGILASIEAATTKIEQISNLGFITTKIP